MEDITPPPSMDLVDAEIKKALSNGRAQILSSDKNNVTILIKGLNDQDLKSTTTLIGSHREIVYRSENEGSGMTLDLEPYDEYVNHPLVFQKGGNEKLLEFMGAYRFFNFDHSLHGLTETSAYIFGFFHISPLMKKLKKLGGTIELGRLISTSSNRRQSGLTLMNLFKALGSYLALPDVKVRFMTGPLSLNLSSYSPASLHLIVEWMRINRPLILEEDGEPIIVQGKTPFVFDSAAQPYFDHLSQSFDLRGMPYSTLVKIVKAIDGKEPPSLLKTYLDLGTKIAGVTFDYKFGVLDLLVVIDLTSLESASYLSKYFASNEQYLEFIKKNRPELSEKDIKEYSDRISKK